MLCRDTPSLVPHPHNNCACAPRAVYVRRDPRPRPSVFGCQSAMMRGGKSPKLIDRGSKKAVAVAGKTSGGGGGGGTASSSASNGGNGMAGKKRKKKKEKQLPSTSSAVESGKQASTLSKQIIKPPHASKTAEKTSSGK